MLHSSSSSRPGTVRRILSRTRWRVGVTALAAVPLIALSSTGMASATSSGHGSPAPTKPDTSTGAGVQSATPYLGWSSWSLQATNAAGVNPEGSYSWLTEAHVLAQAKAMAKLLKSHGYEYVNIDAGWWREWDWTPEYDSHARYAVDKTRFPDGMAYVASYIHKLGLKVGIYMPAGIEKGDYGDGTTVLANDKHCTTADVVYDDLRTTNGWDSSYQLDMDKPCAQKWIDSETAQFASWGIDFLKIDGVGPGSGKGVGTRSPGTNDQYDNRAEIAGWNKGFAKVHRKVLLQLSWALNEDYSSDWAALADSWRVESDIECYCNTLTQWSRSSPFGGASGVITRFTDVLAWIDDAGKGKGWNNLDSLDVGNGTADGLTDTERQTTMTLWAIEAAPLYSGDDLTTLDSYGLKLLTNDEVIGVDQQGDPARPVSTTTTQQVWFAKHKDGTVTVALFNLSDSAATVTANLSDVDVSGSARARDLWTHQDLPTVTGSYSTTLPAHGSQLLTLRPVGHPHA